jgi:hypothetical protein
MADPNLVTIFLAVVTVAVLIQSGIMVGFYFLTAKLSNKTDLAVRQTEKLLGPVSEIAGTVQTISERMATLGADAKVRLHNLDLQSEQDAWHATLNRWTSRSS